MSQLIRLYQIYEGSDGEATKALYERLAAIGPAGAVAVDLFRAQKASARAKVYRGGVRGRGSYRGMAYDRKGWAISNLCASLAQPIDPPIRWGWGIDDKQEYHRHVLYIDLPTGQVSFHSAERADGPDYHGVWDGATKQSADRILRWIAQIMPEAFTPA